jgi:putative endonuclease
MHYFYILFSQKDYKYYYGSTNNLKRRLDEHVNGKVTATKYRLPLRLIYYEAYENLRSARLREQQVKSSGSIRKQLHARLTLHDPDEGPARPPAGKPGQ